MNSEAAHHGRPATTTRTIESNTAAGRELTVEEIVARCREAAAAADPDVVETIGRFRAVRDRLAADTIEFAPVDAVLAGTIRALGGAA